LQFAGKSSIFFSDPKLLFFLEVVQRGFRFVLRDAVRGSGELRVLLGRWKRFRLGKRVRSRGRMRLGGCGFCFVQFEYIGFLCYQCST